MSTAAAAVRHAPQSRGSGVVAAVYDREESCTLPSVGRRRLSPVERVLAAGSLTAGKLAALADVSVVLPDLTETELRRLAVLARGMRSARTGGDTLDVARAAAPVARIVQVALRNVNDLIAASLLLGGGGATAEEMANAEAAVDAVLGLVLDLDDEEGRALVAALAAGDDAPT